MHENTDGCMASDTATATPPLYAMSMLQAWACGQGWSSSSIALQFQEARVDIADLARRFQQGADYVHGMLPPQDAGTEWTATFVIGRVCIPFGEMVAATCGIDEWPAEPAWRHYLQHRVNDHLLAERPTYKRLRRFVAPLALVVTAESMEAAPTLVRDRLQGRPSGMMPFPLERYGRFWIMGTEPWGCEESKWLVQVAMEIDAHSVDAASNAATQFFAAADATAWDTCYVKGRGNPAGKVWTEGRVGQAPDIAHQHRQLTQVLPTQAAGLLPSRFH